MNNILKEIEIDFILLKLRVIEKGARRPERARSRARAGRIKICYDTQI